MEKSYLCIDLKSFYASVECVERGLDSLTTNLVVADPSRGKGAICLAVSPSMKKLGVANRCRIFEIPSNIAYIVAMPRMKKYIEYSANIYAIYLKYIAKDDILVYSIDECFLDVTSYLSLYKKNARELAKILIDDVFQSTGIVATAGIGSNLFLAKVALDIMAKHAPDNIGFLDEAEFKKTIWLHKPITDIWNIGRGISNRLAKYGAYTLHDVTLLDEKLLYKEFGVDAQFLIDHAHGIEPCTIRECHEYKAKSNSLSSGQILFENYEYNDAMLALKEMVELQVLELVSKHLVTNQIFLSVGYATNVQSTGGSMKLGEYTNSYQRLRKYFIDLFSKTTKKELLIRRLTIGFANLIDEAYHTIDLFTDEASEAREHHLQEAIINIKDKYGKNAILKAMNLEEKATTRKRNKLIGGHNSE